MAKNPGLKSLSQILVQVMKNHSLDKALLQARIESQWNSAVGPSIAQHARPEQIRSNKLYVLVDSAPWLQELTMLKPALISKLNAALGRDDKIGDIVLKLGLSASPPAAAHQINKEGKI